MKIPYKILGTGSFLPELVVDNEMLAKIMDTSDDWITSRTGISKRHYCVTETTSDMAIYAASKAIEMAEMDPENIDFIIATTLSADYTTPNMASIVQAKVGARNAFCFDLNAACTGFVQAFDIAMRYLNTDERKTGLIVSSESLTKLVDFEDRRTCVLFGDGAGAAIVSNRQVDGSDLPEANIYEAFIGADGTGGEFMTGKAFERANHPFIPEDMVFEPDRFGHETGIYLSMKGPEVYRFATTAMPLAVEKAVERANLPLEAVDYIVPHQANDRILQASAKRLGIPTEKMISYIAETGNTSSASIPICLDKEVRSGHIRRGHTLVFTGFGGGLTYGACVCIF